MDARPARRYVRGRMPARPPTSVLDLDRVTAVTLSNGLRVRLLPERSTPALSYYTFFRVGSRT